MQTNSVTTMKDEDLNEVSGGEPITIAICLAAFALGFAIGREIGEWERRRAAEAKAKAAAAAAAA